MQLPWLSSGWSSPRWSFCLVRKDLGTSSENTGYKNGTDTLSGCSYTPFYSRSFEPALEFVYIFRSSARPTFYFGIFWNPWEWRQQIAYKRPYISTRLQGFTFHKISTFIFTAMRISYFIRNPNVTELFYIKWEQNPEIEYVVRGYSGPFA